MRRRIAPRVRVVSSTMLCIAIAGAALARQSSSSPVSKSLPSNYLLSATRRADGAVAFTCTHGIDGASTTFAADHSTLSKAVRHDR